MTDILDQAFSNMFSNLPEEIVMRVRAKYEADRQEFIDYVKNTTPSQAPGYWAARSCTKCYGRGIIGELTRDGVNKRPLVCQCVAKSYQAWLTEQRKAFNNSKKVKTEEQGNESNGTEQETSD